MWAGNVSSGTLAGVSDTIHSATQLLIDMSPLHKKEELLPPTFYYPSLGCGESIRLVSSLLLLQSILDAWK